MVPVRDSRGAEQISELLRRMRPEIEQILGGFGVPEDDAVEILQEAIVVLAYRWERVSDPAAWLRAALGRRCRRWLEERPASPLAN
jgi:hypothetical protein